MNVGRRCFDIMISPSINISYLKHSISMYTVNPFCVCIKFALVFYLNK